MISGRKRWMLAAAIIAIGASMTLAIACSDDEDDGGGDSTATAGMNETPGATMGHDETPGETMAANEVHVGLTEYSITDEDTGGDLASPPAGIVNFEAHNNGTLTHEFVVFKTDLPEGSLPTEGSTVDEEGDGLQKIDEIEGVAPGTSEVLSVDLEPGNYVIICNVEGHYQQGMHASLSVM